MDKSTKKIIGITVIILLILAIIWVVYESVKPQPASIQTSNELPNENLGIENIINDLFENEVSNTVENEIVNEVMNEVVNQTENENVNKNNETSSDINENNNDSETVTGTTTSREEKAVELAKKYYEKEYGNSDGIYFDNQGVYGDGRYIVRAGSAGNGVNMYLLVDLNTEIVTKK